MTFTAPYTVPETPPAELLAELDAAAQRLAELTSRAAELTLAMDEHGHRLRVELLEDAVSRELSPRQLLDLLS